MIIAFNYDFQPEIVGVCSLGGQQERWISQMDREGKLKDALDELRAERTTTVRKLEELDTLISGLKDRISGENGRTSVSRTVVIHPTEFSNRGIAEAAEIMIRRANRSLHVKEVVEGLTAGGYEFKTKKPLGSVAPVLFSAAKKKNAKLVFNGKNTYSLKEIESKQQ